MDFGLTGEMEGKMALPGDFVHFSAIFPVSPLSPTEIHFSAIVSLFWAQNESVADQWDRRLDKIKGQHD